MGEGAWWAAVHGVTNSRTRLSDFTFTFHFHALEKEMATHSSVLAWRIPGMREPDGLPSMGSHRVGHDWSDLAAAAAESLVSVHFSASAHFSASYLSTSPFSIMFQSYSFCQIFLNNVPQDPSPEFFHAACLLFLPFFSSWSISSIACVTRNLSL